MSHTGRTLLLLIVTAALYAPTLRYGFVYEDRQDPETFFRPFDVRDVLVKPARSLTVASFAVSDWISPLTPWGYHAVSVGVHLVNVALVSAVAGTVLSPGPALLAAALFAVHPIQTEAVAYISARADLVSVTGVLLALLCVSRGWWVGLLLACGLAVLGKESAVVVGLLVPLWCAHRQRRPPVWVVAIGAGLGLTGALYFVARYPLELNLLTMGQVLITYGDLLLRVLVPVDLSIDHDTLWSQPMQVFGLIGLAAGVLALQFRTWWSFGVLWCLIAVSPRLVVPLLEGLHEHHLYLPMIGLCLCAGAAYEAAAKGSYELSAARASA